MSFAYQIYGLRLHANRRIPGLRPAASAVTDKCIGVWLGLNPPWAIAEGAGSPNLRACSARHSNSGAPTWTLRQLHRGEIELHYADGTQFAIDLVGRNIWATWPDSLTLEDAITYLVGPVLGFVLRCLGTICLHASAIAIDGRAVLFAGHSGAGKSTTAAAFAERGFAVLSDDIVALSLESGQIFVQPGYPRVNLWLDSATALFGNPAALPLLTPTWDKHYLDLTKGGERFQTEALRLSSIYILGGRADDPSVPRIESLSAREQLIALIGNTYANNLLDAHRRAEEFAQLGELVGVLPVRRVVPHGSFSALPRLCQLILDDLDGKAPIPTPAAAAIAHGPV